MKFPRSMLAEIVAIAMSIELVGQVASVMIITNIE